MVLCPRHPHPSCRSGAAATLCVADRLRAWIIRGTTPPDITGGRRLTLRQPAALIPHGWHHAVFELYPRTWTVTPRIWTVTPRIWTVTPNTWTGTARTWTVTPNTWTGTPNTWTGTPNTWTGTARTWTVPRARCRRTWARAAQWCSPLRSPGDPRRSASAYASPRASAVSISSDVLITAGPHSRVKPLGSR
jgi:hypothetical protein